MTDPISSAMAGFQHSSQLFLSQAVMGIRNFMSGLSEKSSFLQVTPDAGGFIVNFAPLQFPAMPFRLRVTMPSKNKWVIENYNFFPYFDLYTDDSNELKFLFLMPYQRMELNTHRFHLMVSQLLGIGNTEM